MKNKIFIFVALALTSNFIKAQQSSPSLDKAFIFETVNNTSNVLNDNYVFADKAKKISRYINEKNKNGEYDKSISYSEFADFLTNDMISQHQDKHLRIVYNPELEKEIVNFVKSEKQEGIVNKKNIEKERSVNFFFKKIEIMPSNIGYIEFTNFPVPSIEATKTIRAAMQFVAHTSAVIIDLRNNRGGSGGTGNEMLSYFFKSKTLLGNTFNRIENKWTENYVENIYSITAGLHLDMPIYILTSEWTFSAAEGFAYAMKYLRNAKIIGERTSGGAHLTRSFSLGNGFVAFVPYVREENVITKTDWEGTGVIPDFEAAKEDALFVAENEILKEKLAHTTDETEYRKIKWVLNYNLSKKSKIITDLKKVRQYLGRFSEFEIFIFENKLMIRDVNNPQNIPRIMIPITKSFFQVANDYQVEFLKNAGNENYAIKMSWNDGWVETIERSK